jgi:peptidyl-prolyl cis-trans isomerase C
MNSKFYLYLGLAWLAILTITDCRETPKDKVVSAADQQTVAKINGRPISQHQLDRFITAMNQNRQPSPKHKPEVEAEVKKNALRKLIRMELLYQESQAKNIAVSKEEVDKVVNRIKSNFPDEDKFRQALAENSSSEKELREDIRRNLSVNSLIDQEILPGVVVTDEESNTFYQKNKKKFNRPESVRVSHILIKLDKDASPEDEAAAKQKMEEIKNRLSNGEDFAELARAYSNCPSAGNGGDLGYIVRGQTVPEFEQCAFGLEQPGQISQVIKTSFGFHILKLGQKRSASTVPYEEAKEAINRYLKNQKLNEKLEEYVRNLYAKAEIESRLDLDEPSAETPSNE